MSNQEHWSIEQYREYQKKGTKKSKYGAVKTSVDGQTFDSKKEADYYCNLKFSVYNRIIRKIIPRMVRKTIKT